MDYVLQCSACCVHRQAQRGERKAIKPGAGPILNQLEIGNPYTDCLTYSFLKVELIKLKNKQ